MAIFGLETSLGQTLFISYLIFFLLVFYTVANVRVLHWIYTSSLNPSHSQRVCKTAGIFEVGSWWLALLVFLFLTTAPKSGFPFQVCCWENV